MSAPALGAALRVSPLFSKGVVLQRARPVPVWGWAEPGSRVVVRFAGQAVEAVATKTGRWEARLAPLEASCAPQTMTICGPEEVGIEDVLVELRAPSLAGVHRRGRRRLHG